MKTKQGVSRNRVTPKHLREFEVGDRVLYFKMHHSHAQYLKAQLGNKGTVQGSGRNSNYDSRVKYLVKFDRTMGGHQEWWVSGKHLKKTD